VELKIGKMDFGVVLRLLTIVSQLDRVV